MTERKSRAWPLLTQLLLILMGIVLLYLALGFARQVSVSLQRQQEVKDLDGQINATVEERAVLEQTLQQMLSDTAVEKWAREHGWAKPDQVLVVPVGGLAAPSEEQVVPQESVPPSSPQEAWWNRFFGNR